MKAHKLARLLLKMPNIEVGYSHVDNYSHEVAGETCGVSLLIKADIDTSGFGSDAMHMYDALPDRIVVITG